MQRKLILAMTIAALFQAGCVVTPTRNTDGAPVSPASPRANLPSPIASNCAQSSTDLVGGVVMGLVNGLISDPLAKNIAGTLGGMLTEIANRSSFLKCNPFDHLAKASKIGEPFSYNGLKLQQTNGFPVEAFYGLPPIVDTQDLRVAYQTAASLAENARRNYQAGEEDLAFAQMYWARRIYTVAISVSGASAEAFRSARTKPTPGGGSTTVMTIPAGALAVIPGAAQSRSRMQAAANAFDLSQGIKVASNDMRVIGEVLNQALPVDLKNMAQRSFAPGVSDFGKLKPGAVFETENGLRFSQRNGDMVVHNDTSKPLDIETSRLGHSLPRGGLTDEDEQVGRLFETMVDTVTRETVYVYGLHPKRAKQGYDVRFHKPNVAIDRRAGNAPVVYVDANGQLTRDARAGQEAYRASSIFRMASDRYHLVDRNPEIERFRSKCYSEKLGHYDGTKDGGNTFVVMCFKAPPGSPPSEIVATRMFYVDKKGKIGQTEASIIKDQAAINEFKRIMGIGKQASEVAAAFPVGIIDAGALCFDKTTPLQVAALSSMTEKGYFSSSSEARILGWKPDASEWNSDRILNCVSIIPGAGYAAGAAKKIGDTANLLSKVRSAQLAKVRDVALLFSMPTTKDKAISGAKKAEEIFKNAPRAARFAKGAFDATSFVDTFSDAAELFLMVK